jgi:hypothetical protein
MPSSSSGLRSSIYVTAKFMVDNASKARALQAIESISASGQNWMGRYRNTVNALNKEFEVLAREIGKLSDPGQRAAFSQRFEDLRTGLMSTLETNKKTKINMLQTYKEGQMAVRDMVLEVRNLNDATREQLNAEKQFESSGFREAFRWGITGFALTMASQTVKRFGMSIMSPIQKFMSVQNLADPVYRRGNQAFKQIELSVVRIGRIMLREWLPTIEKIADVASKIADYVEKNPEIAKNAVAVGAGAVVIGQLGTVVGSILSMVAAWKSLSFLSAVSMGGAEGASAIGLKSTAQFLIGGSIFKSLTAHLKTFGAFLASTVGTIKGLGFIGILRALGGGLKTLATGALRIATSAMKLLGGIFTKLAALLIKFVTSVAGAVTGGLLVGFGVNELIAKSEAGKQAGFQEFGKIATVAAYKVGGIGGEETGLAWARKVAEAFGYVEKSADGANEALEDTSTIFDLIAEDAIALYSDYIKAEQEAKAELEASITDTNKDYEKKRSEAVEEYAKQRLELEQNYQEEVSDLTQDYQRDRARMIEDHNRQMSRMQQEYLRDVEREQEDYERDAAKALADYQRDRARTIEDMNNALAELDQKYHDDTEDARRDFLRRMEQLEADHDLRVNQLVADRDALGLVEEQRRYENEKSQLQQEFEDRMAELQENLEQQRQRIREDYAQRLAEMDANFRLEQQRRQEDHQLKLQEMQENFELERQRRNEDFAQQMEERAEQYSQRMQQLQEAHREELQELQDQHREELIELRNANQDKLRELRDAYEEERRQRAEQLRQQTLELIGIQQEGYDAMAEAARAYVERLIEESERLNTGAAQGSRASGGYVSRGTWQMHDGEFVLTKPTVDALERAQKSPLTQAGVLASLTRQKGGVQTSMSATINQHFTFEGEIGAGTRAMMRREAYRAAQQGVLDAVGA